MTTLTIQRLLKIGGLRKKKTLANAVIYARYSSILQNERSIDDQVALCQAFAARNGFEVVGIYSDNAKSGSSLFERDGLIKLLSDARNGEFKAVVVEALDRVSRDQEDMASIWKRLRFAGVDIVAVHDGKADTVQIGIRSLIGAVYLEDLKHKTRRGMAGRVREGKSPGGKAYGYKPVLGKPGELVIDEEEAAIVRRIFTEFSEGKSARHIAYGLNSDGIPAARGSVWQASSIKGSKKRANGLLRTKIYNGKIVWNRVRMVRDPDTGKRVSRANPVSEHQVADAPHLRIVDQKLFDAVQAIIDGTSIHTIRKPSKRRPRLLSGLLKCGGCGGGMTLDGLDRGNPRIRCVRSREAGTCDHTRKYRLDTIERSVVDILREQLANPSLLAEYVSAYTAERRRLADQRVRERRAIEKRLADAKSGLDRIIDAYMKGVISVDQLAERKPPLEAAIEQCQREISNVIAPPVVELHPQAIAAYHRDIDFLHERLSASDFSEDVTAWATTRRLIAEVRINPSRGWEPVTGSIQWRLATLLGADFDPSANLAKEAENLVAGIGSYYFSQIPLGGFEISGSGDRATWRAVPIPLPPLAFPPAAMVC